MSIFSSFDINASGMTAERVRLDVISQNIANASTTRTEDGTPYRRKVVSFSEKSNTAFANILSNAHSSYSGTGVKVSAITEDNTTDFVKTYDPAHPDADADGYVSYPNVNTVTEMTNMIDASRAYEANVTAFTTSKSIALKGLEIGK
ncbi:MAG: flagellar basal body rod protein FlgC [Lachnotalea sp.]